MKEEIIYSINTTDLQTVAQEVLNRELSENEIMQLKELVPERIKWFEAIEASILEIIQESTEK